MPWHYFGIRGSSDSRKRFFGGLDVGYAITSAFKHSDYYRGDFNVRYRFNDQLSIELQSGCSLDKGNVGFAFQRESNGDPIIGWRDVTQYTNVLNAIINFTPRMFLTLRARHYWSKVNYFHFYNVDENGYWVERPFISGNNDNYNAYNLDMFYTWDFMYGSRFILGWKNWLPQDETIDGTVYQGYFKNMRQVFTKSQGREISARLIYFLDHTKLKRTKHTVKQ